MEATVKHRRLLHHRWAAIKIFPVDDGEYMEYRIVFNANKAGPNRASKHNSGTSFMYKVGGMKNLFDNAAHAVDRICEWRDDYSDKGMKRIGLFSTNLRNQGRHNILFKTSNEVRLASWEARTAWAKEKAEQLDLVLPKWVQPD